MSLSHKVVLITGAAHRIGATIARLLHSEGANIVLHYRQSKTAAQALQAELQQTRPESVSLVQGDLLQVEDLPALVEKVISDWGDLHVLVNNASSFYPTSVGQTNLQQWEDLLGSNLRAPFFLSQAAVPALKKSQGCIVNIVDIHGERPLKNYPVYSIAKAGLAMLTRSLACELGPEIRVNGVAPGAILWPEQGLDESSKAKIVSRTFLKRQGDPMDIARAVLYLVRDAEYVSGQVLTVDGGRSINS